MKRRVLGAVGIVLALVLFGAWWLQRDRGAIARVSTQRAIAGAAQPAVAPGAAAGERAPVTLDEDPDGKLRLEGQVVDTDARGVAGVTVVVSSTPPRSMLTEADGSFAFDGLVARTYVVVARAPQSAAGPVVTRLTERSEPVVLRLRPASSLEVTVTRSRGKPVADAVVELRGLDVQRIEAHGGPAVFSPVIPGVYQVAAWAPGLARAYQRVDIGTGDFTAQLTLAPGAAVSGRVVDEHGQGIGRARIVYRSAADWAQHADEQNDAAVTAADGSFRFDALPAGSFRFTATHAERAPATSPRIELDGSVARDDIVIAMTAGAVVRGHVVDDQHHPVASAQVSIATTASASSFVEPLQRQAYSDASGGFEIRGLPRTPLLALARHEAGSSETVPIDPTRGDVGDAVLVISVTGKIAGTVVDALGQPVEGARVMTGLAVEANRDLFSAGRGRLRELPETRSDAAGRFALSGLSPGRYRLVAVPATRAPDTADIRGGVNAMTGETAVRLAISADGAVKGRVAFGDGAVPELFRITLGHSGRSFAGGDGSFTIDALVPGSHRLEVRGPSFQTRTIDIAVEPTKTTDAGTITVVKGRAIAGVVVADGRPVAGATVYAGRVLIGSGDSSAAPGTSSPAGDASDAHTATSDAQGRFSLFGLGEGDMSLVAEQPEIGRSRALRIAGAMPGQSELTIVLEKYGSLRGTLRQPGQPTEGIAVTSQSTSTPGAVYRVVADSDGSFRFDRLAPDTYKVSAMLRASAFGARFYSQQVAVISGRETSVELAVEPGALTLAVTARTASGAIGAASAWLASGTIDASTLTDLTLKLASAGPGTSVRLGIANGETKQFTDLAPGTYSVCITPLPVEIRPAAALDYMTRHADTLATFCKSVELAAAPREQSIAITVAVPPLASDGRGASPPGANLGPGASGR